MIRTCKWCKRKYDTSKGETSLFCEKNPYRDENRKRKNDPRCKSNIVKIACLIMK